MTRAAFALAFAVVVVAPLAPAAQIFSMHPSFGPVREGVSFDFDFSTDRLDVRISRDGYTDSHRVRWPNIKARRRHEPARPGLHWDMFDGIRQPEPAR